MLNVAPFFLVNSKISSEVPGSWLPVTGKKNNKRKGKLDVCARIVTYLPATIFVPLTKLITGESCCQKNKELKTIRCAFPGQNNEKTTKNNENQQTTTPLTKNNQTMLVVFFMQCLQFLVIQWGQTSERGYVHDDRDFSLAHFFQINVSHISRTTGRCCFDFEVQQGRRRFCFSGRG
jgi:hypothetical protein